MVGEGLDLCADPFMEPGRTGLKDKEKRDEGNLKRRECDGVTDL